MKTLLICSGLVAWCAWGCGTARSDASRLDQDTANLEFMGGDNLGDLGGVNDKSHDDVADLGDVDEKGVHSGDTE